MISVRSGLLIVLAGPIAGCQSGVIEMDSHSAPRGGAAPGSTLPAPAPAAPSVDEKGALASIAHQRYQTSPDFTRVSVIYASTKDPVNVAIWISTDAAPLYRLYDPNSGPTQGPGVHLPEGTVVVRAVYDPSNTTDFSAVKALTLMVKGEPGYNLATGDWAFAVTDADGNLLDVAALEGTNNGSLPDHTLEFGAGASRDCAQGCHENQRGVINDDMFGVPKAHQVP